MNETLVKNFILQNEWSNYTLGDLKKVIQSLLLLTLSGDSLEGKEFWVERCEPEINHLLATFALMEIPDLVDQADKSDADLVFENSQKFLTLNSKHYLLATYKNTFFLQMISLAELPKLLSFVKHDENLDLADAIDFYITHLLYSLVLEDPNNLTFTYLNLANTSEQRRNELQQIREDIVAVVERVGAAELNYLASKLTRPFSVLTSENVEDLVPLFKSLFMLMTYYVGSNYRRIHDAVTTLLGVDMRSFREDFFAGLPDILRRRGGVVPQISLEATLAEMDAVLAKSDVKEGSKQTSSGGCYIATSVFGSYDCPEVWVLRRFRDQKLAQTVAGRAAIKIYYAVSPQFLKLFGDRGAVVFKKSLNRFVNKLLIQGYSDKPYFD